MIRQAPGLAWQRAPIPKVTKPLMTYPTIRNYPGLSKGMFYVSVCAMTVNIPKELEPFIEQKIRAGQFPDASAVVTEAVRQFSEQQRDWNEDSPELKAFLLEAVHGEHRPLRLEELEEMEQRVLSDNKSR